MKKIILVLAMMVLLTSVLAGCSTPDTDVPDVTQAPIVTEAPDVVTGASVVTDDATLLKAASKDGTWILIFEKDLTTTKEIVLEGYFEEPDRADPTKMVEAGRKIALYTQDADRKVTAKFTLTAPKLIVKSEKSKIQSGTFVGDIYVEAKNFSLVDTKVDGNIYFATEELKTSFKMDDKSSVTGVQEVKK